MVDFTASDLYPIKDTNVNFVVTGKTFTSDWSMVWTFFDEFDNRIYPEYVSGTQTSLNITVKFNEYNIVTCIFKASKSGNTTPPPDPNPDPIDDPFLVLVVKHDYLRVISSSMSYSYSLTSPSLDSLTLTTTGFKELDIKLTNLNPLTLVEDNITSSIQNITTTSSTYGFVTLQQEVLDISLPVSTCGIYYLYTRFNSKEYKHIFINIKIILEYIDATSLQNICCSANSTVNYPEFKQKDYVFNVISNLVNSFLGIELSDLEFNYGEITDGDNIYANKVYQCTSVGTSSTSWIIDNHFVLETITGNPIFSTSHLTVGDTYKALYTSSPTFGGDKLSAYTNDLHIQMQDMAEIIYKINQYLIGNDNISC